MELLKDITVTDVAETHMYITKKGITKQKTDRDHWALLLCIEGHLVYSMGGKTFESRPDNAVLLPKGANYSFISKKDGLHPQIDFECTGLACSEILQIPLDDPQQCIRDYHAIANLTLWNDPLVENPRLQKISLFYQLLDRICRPRPMQHRLIAPVLEYIEQHFAERELSNKRLAQQAGISEVYLRQLFQAQLGTSPWQYVLDIRIRKAQQLLTEMPYTVSAIAEMCGFSSLYHFCRAFRQKVGMTPSQYAHQMRQQGL